MIVKPLLAAALLVAPAPTATAQVSPVVDASVPVDAVARAKLPKEDGQLVDAIAAINALVNNGIEPESDYDHYGVMDYWVMMPPDGKGDCEDYALTKLFLLQQAGFPMVTNSKLVGVIAYGQGHEILALLLPEGEVIYLDNMNPEPMTRAELVAEGYIFFDWKA